MSKMSHMAENMLKIMWEIESPINLKEIMEKTGLRKRAANMYLLNLRKAGYVLVSEGGYYSLTENGKGILGFPKLDDNLAKRILSKTSPEKAFNFYSGIGQPLGVFSDNLVDFSDKIRSVDIRAIEFHMSREDFELWIHYLGDIELAKRLRLIKDIDLTGEKLRENLYYVLKRRCDELLTKVV